MNPLLSQMSQQANRDPRLIASVIADYCEEKGVSRKQLALELELGQDQLAKLGLCRLPDADNLATESQQIAAYAGISPTELRRFLRSTRPDIYRQRRPLMMGAWLEELFSMFSRRRVVAYGLAAIVVLIVSAFAFAQPSSGTEATLVVSEGEATVVQANRVMLVVPNRTETAVAAGSILAVSSGDTITLPGGAAAQLKLSDGSSVDLAADTTLQISELITTEESYRVRLRLLAGRTVNRVVRLLGQDDTFEIQTPSSTASVRGTIFTVAVISPSETYVSCDEGVVRVTMAGNFVDLNPGEEVTAVLGQPLTLRSQAGAAAPAAPAPLPPTATPVPTETAVPPTPTSTSTVEATTTPTPTLTATPTPTLAITATIAPVATPVTGDIPGDSAPPDSGDVPPDQDDEDNPDAGGPPGQVPGNPPGDNPGQGNPPDGGGTPPGQGGTPPGQQDKPPKDKDKDKD